MKRCSFVLAVLLIASPLHGRQDTEKKLAISDFESDSIEWTGMKAGDGAFGPDDDAKLSIAHEAASVKSGKGALQYEYSIASDMIPILALPRALDLTGMKSLRFWVKCSNATAIVVGLNEAGGASYQAAAHCTAGAWQEIAINLDELVVDDPAKDANGKLDLDQVASISLIDLSGFLVSFLPELKGPRKLWLDDVSFSSKAVPQSTGPAEVTKVVPIYLVDNFETPVIRWIPVGLDFAEGLKFSIFDGTVAIDRDAPQGGGKQSLKFSYPRKGKKVHGIMRNLEKIDLAKATALELSLKGSHEGTCLVTIEEKGGARYNRKIDLVRGVWKSFSWKLSDFTLAEDSHDDNGKLDSDQIKQISVVDLTMLVGGGEAEVAHLWLDEVRFLLAP